MSLKKITSLTMLLVMIIMTFSGIMLFIAPPGRVAHWANWEVFGLTKELYGDIHSTFMVLFIVATILHIYYNWKPLTSYLKNSAKEMIFFTKDMIVASFITLVFLIGTIYSLSPFSNFLDFGSEIKNSWEKEYGTAPYSHAELSSLKSFVNKLGYDLDESKKILISNNISFTEDKSLSQIAKENGLSPQFIYTILRKNFEKKGVKVLAVTGLGKKTVSEVAQAIDMDVKEFINELKNIGIDANENDGFKEVCEFNDLSPMEVMGKLGYKKPQ